MPKVINKFLLYFSFIILFSFLSFSNATCTNAECASYYDGPEPGDYGWYSCASGTMCCIRDGCPSWVCQEIQCIEWKYVCDQCCCESYCIDPVCGNWTWCGDDDGTYKCCPENCSFLRMYDCNCRSVCKTQGVVDVSCDGACADCPNAPPPPPPPPPENTPAVCESFTCNNYSLAAAGETPCTVTGSDVDDDDIIFEVSSSCGSFNPASGTHSDTFGTSYTAPGSNGNCTLSASVHDAGQPPDSCDSLTIVVSDFTAWFSSRNGDIYTSGSISKDMPSPPLGQDWQSALIQAGIGGYVYTAGDLNVGSNNAAVVGGYAEQLGGGYSDIALTNYNFEAPTHASVETITSWDDPKWDALKGDGIYKVSSAVINARFASGVTPFFTINRTGPNDEFLLFQIPVVYVTGNEDIVISSWVQRWVGNAIFVISGNLIVKGSAGVVSPPIATSDPGVIQANFIVGGDITIENDPEVNPDDKKTVRIYGPLVAKGKILNHRDLGTKNSEYPSLVVSWLVRGYMLAKIARYHPDIPDYLGLATFDVQFVVPNEIR